MNSPTMISLHAAGPYAYVPGNFHSFNYNQSIFHSGDVKFEANLELRFPIVWKIFGAAFLDAGNVWGLYNTSDVLSAEDYALFVEKLGIKEVLKDGKPDLTQPITGYFNIPSFFDALRLNFGIGYPF